MAKRAAIRVMAVILSGVLMASCNNGVSPVPISCPPISPSVKATVPGVDTSSIEIRDKSTGIDDVTGNPWCDTHELGISVVDLSLSTLPSLPFGTPLAALDVDPDDVSFKAELISRRPELVYDLQQHPSPSGCEACSHKVYQLAGPDPNHSSDWWRYVGSAKVDSSSVPVVARASIFHLSIYALVEIPPPDSLPGPGAFAMIVNSDFLGADQGAVEVEFIVVEDRQDVLESISDTRLFRFTRIEPSYEDPNLPAECTDLIEPPEQLTCLFPLGSVVEVEVVEDPDGWFISIVSVDRGYVAELFVASVEVY